MTDQTASEAHMKAAREALYQASVDGALVFLEDAESAVSSVLLPLLARLSKAERAVNLLADSHRRAEQLQERLRLLTDEKVAYVTGPTTDLLCEEIDRLKAEVAAARKFAGEMQNFCSPHGVAAGYAARLVEAMDRAKEGR